MNELIEGLRRSKLTFVASRESTDCVAVDRLMRAREPVSRSKSGVQGKGRRRGKWAIATCGVTKRAEGISGFTGHGASRRLAGATFLS
jgi:hypothetical protein